MYTVLSIIRKCIQSSELPTLKFNIAKRKGLINIAENSNNSSSSHESRDTVEEFMVEEQIVDFSDQNPMSEVKRNDVPVTVPRFLSCNTEARNHSIFDFLKRPRNVSSITWSTTDAINDQLGSWYCPDILFTTEMNLCKIRDFRYLRCNIVFEFKLNINVMSVGRLIVYTYPQPFVIGGNLNNADRASKTGFQHGFIDAGTSQVLRFKVPFVFRKAAYDFLVDAPSVADPDGNPWAQVDMHVFNVLQATSGSSSGTVAVWVHAEDIELDIPTKQAIPVYSAPVARPPQKYNFKAQMKTDDSQDNSKEGQISDKLHSVSQLGSTVAQMGLGPVSEIAGAASWVADIASKSMRAFGYAKPKNKQTIAPMIQQPMKNYTHCVGDDSSIVLGMDPRNSINVNTRLFATTHDEMDINWVISKPMLLESFQWSKAQVTGTVISWWPVTPGYCAGSTTTTVAPSFLAYVSHMFELWRGSITYKLSFVGNHFYQGSLALAYLSGVYTNPGASITPDEIEAAPKIVCQITNSTECVFKVPYALATPFCEVRLGSRNAVNDFMIDNLLFPEISTGIVVLYVVNQLTGPATVPNVIDVNLFVSGGADMTFAIDSCPRYAPVPRTIPVPVRQEKTPERRKPVYKAQANLGVPQNLNLGAGEQPVMQHTMLKSNDRPKDIRFHEMSMGDASISLRSLTRQFSIIYEGTIPLNDALTVDPAYFGWDETSTWNCRFWRIARMYAYWRGSVRYKFMPNIPQDQNYPVVVVRTYRKELSPPDSPTIITGSFPSNENIGFFYAMNIAQTPVLEIELPFYQNRFIAMNSNINSVPRNKAQISVNFPAACSFALSCAAGDDFTFGFLIAPPPLQFYA